MLRNLRKVIISITIVVFLILSTGLVSAGKCENNSGVVRSNIRYKNESGDWGQWSTKIRPDTLEGKTIEFRINVTFYQDCNIDLSLKKEVDYIVEKDENINMFEIIDGPTSDFGEIITINDCLSGEYKVFNWTIQQTLDEKILGIFSFEGRVEFDAPEEPVIGVCQDHSQIIVWNQTNKDTSDQTPAEENDNSGNEDTKDTPGFLINMVLIGCSIANLIIIKLR